MKLHMIRDNFIQSFLCFLTINAISYAAGQDDGVNGNVPESGATAVETIAGFLKPSVFSVLVDEDLRALLNLSPAQSADVDRLLEERAVHYLEISKDAPGRFEERRSRTNSRSQFGLRDRALLKTVRELLNESQQRQLSRMMYLWNFGPVHIEQAYRYQPELRLTTKQASEIQNLNKMWVLTAIEKVQGDESTEPLYANEVLEPVLSDAYAFRRSRDESLENILSDNQLRRWRQLDLQNWVKLGPELLLNGHTEEASKRALDDGLVPYLVPYYELRLDDMNWTGKQRGQLRQLSLEIDSFYKEKNYRAWLDRQNAVIPEIDSLLSEEQRIIFREMIGEDAVVKDKIDC